jgi:hypothetical protein
MIFNFDIDTPANTAETSPVKTTKQIIRGTITEVLVFWPPGSNGLAHLKILWGLYQLFPSNQDGDFAESGTAFAWPENINIDHDPAELTFLTWNADDTYAHTCHVNVVMQPSNVQPTIEQVVSALSSGSTPTPPGSET